MCTVLYRMSDEMLLKKRVFSKALAAGIALERLLLGMDQNSQLINKLADVKQLKKRRTTWKDTNRVAVTMVRFKIIFTRKTFGAKFTLKWCLFLEEQESGLKILICTAVETGSIGGRGSLPSE